MRVPLRQLNARSTIRCAAASVGHSPDVTDATGSADEPREREDDVLHPRPQLTRTRWTDLSGPWGFAHDDADVGLDEGWHTRAGVYDRTIQVPFPPESPASGIAETGFHPVVWYRRTFRSLDAGLRPGERLLLHFGAVDYRASVWVNGALHIGVGIDTGESGVECEGLVQRPRTRL